MVRTSYRWLKSFTKTVHRSTSGAFRFVIGVSVDFELWSLLI